jgi:hypothetical protein
MPFEFMIKISLTAKYKNLNANFSLERTKFVMKK